MAPTTRAPADADPQQQLYAALAAYQAEASGVQKDGKNPHFRSTYATLASTLTAIQPATAHGLSHSITFESTDGGELLVATLYHTAGGTITSRLPIAFGPDWQKNGSAITYARRYALLALYGLAAEDDDGNDATPAPRKSVQAATRTTAKAPAHHPNVDSPEWRAKVLANAEGAIERAGLTELGRATLIYQITNGQGQTLEDVRTDWLEQLPMAISRTDAQQRLNAGQHSKSREQLLTPPELPATWGVPEAVGAK